MRPGMIVALLAGCDSVFSTTPPDAPPPPGVDPCDPLAVVPASIAFEGTMRNAVGDAPIAMLDVDATPGGSAITNDQGQFRIDIATDEQPISVRFTLSGTTTFSLYELHYQRPFTRAISDISEKLNPREAIESLYATNGVTYEAEQSTLQVSLRDCNGNGIADAEVAMSPAAVRIVYQGGGTSTNGTGTAYALGVPPGELVISAGRAAPLSASVRAGAVGLLFLVQP